MKSFVTMEQRMCSVCGRTYDTGAILLDQRLRERFERHTVTGYGLCPEDQGKYDAGFIALVEVDPTKSNVTGSIMQPENAHRTGRLAHIKVEAFKRIFNIDSHRPDGTLLPMVFIDINAFEHVLSLRPPEERQ